MNSHVLRKPLKSRIKKATSDGHDHGPFVPCVHSVVRLNADDGVVDDAPDCDDVADDESLSFYFIISFN